MARNPVQYQKGLSLIEFNRRCGTDEQCHGALVAMRWPDGFECPHCKGRKHSYSPAACRVQTSVPAGTVFHKSHTPLAQMVPRHLPRHQRQERHHREFTAPKY